MAPSVIGLPAEIAADAKSTDIAPYFELIDITRNMAHANVHDRIQPPKPHRHVALEKIIVAFSEKLRSHNRKPCQVATGARITIARTAVGIEGGIGFRSRGSLPEADQFVIHAGFANSERVAEMPIGGQGDACISGRRTQVKERVGEMKPGEGRIAICRSSAILHAIQPIRAIGTRTSCVRVSDRRIRADDLVLNSKRTVGSERPYKGVAFICQSERWATKAAVNCADAKKWGRGRAARFRHRCAKTTVHAGKQHMALIGAFYP